MVIYYNKLGEEIEKPYLEKDLYKVLAKKMIGNEINRYWAAYANGMLVETKKLNDGELRSINSKMTEVPESVFLKYMKYLQSKTQRMSVSNIRND